MSTVTVNRGRVRDAWGRSERFRYLALGLWNTAFAYLAYFALYGLFHARLHYLVIGVLCHLAAVTNAFVCQRFFVFRSTAPWGPAYLRFNLVQLLVLAVSIGGLTLQVEVFRLNPVSSQLIVMTICVIGGYLLNRRYTFKVKNP